MPIKKCESPPKACTVKHYRFIMDKLHSKVMGFVAVESHFQWVGQTLTCYGVRTLQICNVFIVQVSNKTFFFVADGGAK